MLYNLRFILCATHNAQRYLILVCKIVNLP